MKNLSFEISKYPRDLLQRFLGGGGDKSQAIATSSSSSMKFSLDDSNIVGNDVDDDDDDESEGGLNLGLGLSLGGRFGVDKSSKGLIRSSSLACTMPLFRDDETTIAIQPTRGVSSLVRTSSLPVESEEEWRKRKEMQTLRRMEAKRRRSEKQRVLKEGGCVGGGEEKCVEDLKFRGRLEKEQQSLRISSKLRTLFGSSTPPPTPTPTPTSNKVEVKARRTTFGSLQGFLIAQARAQTQAQARDQHGSGKSQEVTSSGASEPESKTNQASSICGEAKTPTSTHSLQEPATQEALVSSGAKSDTSQRIAGGEPELETSSKQPEFSDPNMRQETGSSSGMEDMPCVFTIGDGPNGRKVEGILYRYGKGEGVRIMCVCHGTFLSPKDFVKHAGGRVDVEHPLRHIVVSPSSSAFQ